MLICTQSTIPPLHLYEETDSGTESNPMNPNVHWAKRAERVVKSGDVGRLRTRANRQRVFLRKELRK